MECESVRPTVQRRAHCDTTHTAGQHAKTVSKNNGLTSRPPEREDTALILKPVFECQRGIYHRVSCNDMIQPGGHGEGGECQPSMPCAVVTVQHSADVRGHRLTIKRKPQDNTVTVDPPAP